MSLSHTSSCLQRPPPFSHFLSLLSAPLFQLSRCAAETERERSSLVLPWCQFVYRGVLKVSDKCFLLVCAAHASANIALFGRYFHINADFRAQVGTSRTFIDPVVELLIRTRIKLMFLSPMNKSTQSILPFCVPFLVLSFRRSRTDRCRVFHHVWLKG